MTVRAMGRCARLFGIASWLGMAACSPGSSKDVQADHDFQCALALAGVGGHFAEDGVLPDAGKLKAAEIQTAFFLGRLSARSTDAKWYSAWKAEIKRTEGQRTGKAVGTAQECLAEVQRITAQH